MNDFRTIEKDCGLEGRVLRPLSAGLLPETEPERLGIVDRQKLYAVHGQSRQMLLELAEKYGIENPPSASPGCALTSPDFSKKVRDVFRHHPDYERWEFEILKIGRHFRLDGRTKAVIARNHAQNEYLEVLHPEGTALLKCRNFGGPHGLVIGNINEINLQKTGALMLRYAQKPVPEFCEIERHGRENDYFVIPGVVDERLVESSRVV